MKKQMVLDMGMLDGLKIGDIVIYRSGHSATVHDRAGMHYIVTELGERRFDGRCVDWTGPCPACVASPRSDPKYNTASCTS